MTRILIIDDDVGMCEMLAFALSLEGWNVETVSSGAQALEAVRRAHYDVAVTDLRMPGMDGLQTLVAMMKLDPTLFIIVATGCASPESREACLAAGARAYLEKPFELDELRRLIQGASELRLDTASPG